MQEILTLTITTDKTFSEEGLNVRYTLVDTIEQRKIGQIIEEGSDQDSVYVAIRSTSAKGVKNKVEPILLSLGLLASTEFRIIAL